MSAMQEAVKLFASILIVGIAHVGIAKAENWQTVGIDKDAMGNDMRTIAIDLDSIQSTADEVSVNERVTSNSRGNVGYNCSEGEIRHGFDDLSGVNKEIANMICNKPASPHPYSAHVENWQTVHVDKVGQLKIDLNSIFRAGDEVMITQMTSSNSEMRVHYDCKGYYKSGNGTWGTLDMTDHIATVPRGYVSLERKSSNKVCSITKR